MTTRLEPGLLARPGKAAFPLVALLLLAMGSAGCASCRGDGEDGAGPSLPEPLTLTETEPNNRPDQALQLTEDADVTGNLSVTPSRPDEDWYQLDPGGAGPRVDLRVEPAPGTDVSFELYDAFRNRLVAVNSQGVGETERMPNLYLTGRRFVRVISAKPGSGGAYTLHIRFTPAEPGEEEEPNDSAETANAIPAETPVTGLLGHAGDEDWYRFELKPGGTVGGSLGSADDFMRDGGPDDGPVEGGAQPGPGGADLEGQPLPDRQDAGTGSPEGRTDWNAPQGAQEPVREAPRYGEESGSVIPPEVRDEESVIPGDDRPERSRREQLWARLNAERDGAAEDEAISEDNQDAEGAPFRSPEPGLPGDPDGVVRAPTTPGNPAQPDVPQDSMDLAWRAATAALLGEAINRPTEEPPPPPSVALRLELTGIEGVSQEVRVLSEDLSVRFETTTAEGQGLRLRHIGVSPEDRFVYVVVRPAWIGKGKEARRAYSASLPYTLTLAVEEEGAHAELEPNDDPAQATPLTPQTYREGFLSQPEDVDYFVLDAPEPVLADFQVTAVPDVDLALILVEKTDTGTRPLISARNGDVNEGEQLNAVRCEGTCLVRVESAMKRVDGKLVKGFSNPDVPYRITVSTTPDDGSHEREPNNKAADATPIQLAKPIRGTIHPVKDVDFYRLDLSDRVVRTPIRVHLSGLLKVDLALFLHRLEGDGGTTLVQSADSGSGDEGERLNYSAEPGVWILEVRDARNRGENAQDRYQLTVQVGG
jgi:hypothetical protein